MQEKKNLWIWVGVAVVVVIIVLVFVWKPQSSPNPGTGTSPTNVPQGTPAYAPTGQTVAGFPQSLVLDPGAQLTTSYSINYSSSTNQYTAEWNSTNSVSAMYAKYQSYFQSNGWTITNQQVKATFSGVYATQGTTQASVTIEPQGNGSMVIVGYVTGQ